MSLEAWVCSLVKYCANGVTLMATSMPGYLALNASRFFWMASTWVWSQTPYVSLAFRSVPGSVYFSLEAAESSSPPQAAVVTRTPRPSTPVSIERRENWVVIGGTFRLRRR